MIRQQAVFLFYTLSVFLCCTFSSASSLLPDVFHDGLIFWQFFFIHFQHQYLCGGFFNSNNLSSAFAWNGFWKTIKQNHGHLYAHQNKNQPFRILLIGTQLTFVYKTVLFQTKGVLSFYFLACSRLPVERCTSPYSSTILSDWVRPYRQEDQITQRLNTLLPVLVTDKYNIQPLILNW